MSSRKPPKEICQIFARSRDLAVLPLSGTFVGGNAKQAPLSYTQKSDSSLETNAVYGAEKYE
jgi:hypothetical protein